MFKKVSGLLCCLLVALTIPVARALTIDFGSLPGAYLEFNGTGDTFRFVNNSSGNSFQIRLSDSPGSPSVGLMGSIDGVYNIGPGVITAPVTGLGFFRIEDGATPFLAKVHWVSIHELGSGGVFNINAQVNLESAVYHGTNPDLKGLGKRDEVTLAYTFLPGRSLATLRTDGVVSRTSFTGDITPVSEQNSTAMLLGIGFAGLLGFRKFRS